MPSKSLLAFRNLNRAVLIFALVFALDQWTKELFASEVTLNTGVSFSLFAGASSVWLSGVLAVLVLVLGWFLRPSEKQGRLALWGTLFFFGGAISNLFDRVRYGGVRDIWLIPGTNVQNNLADWFIAIGVFALIISTLQRKNPSEPRTDRIV